MTHAIQLAYLLATALFVFALHWMNDPKTARRGVVSGVVAMALAILGIVGAFVATFLGQAIGWYGPNQGAGFIGAIVGAVVVLFIYGLIAGRRTTTY